MSHIFISYSRKDIDIAEKIVTALAQNNYNTWIDWKSIPKGEEFLNEIYRGIEGTDVFLFLISPDSVESKWCNAEIKHAAENNKRIIPISIRDTKAENTPSEIGGRNWIFCRDGKDSFASAIAETLEAISSDYKWVRAHTNLQIKALEWEKRNKKGGLLSGALLREAQELITLSGQKDPQPTDLQRLFVNESQKTESRNRNWILTISGIVIASLAFLALFANNQGLLAINNEATAQANLEVAQTAQADAQSQAATAQAANTLAVEQSYIANANDEKSKINRSADLAAQSLIARDTNFPLSMLLSVEAYKTYKTGGTLGLLLKNVFTPPKLLPSQIKIDDYIYTLAYAPDGKILATSGNKKISLWDSKTWQLVTTLDSQEYVHNLAFSPDGQLLASSSEWDDSIIIWNIKNFQVIGKLNSRYTNNPTNLRFSPDGKSIAANCNGTINIWEMDTINNIDNFQEPTISINGDVFIYSPDGQYLITSQENKIIFRDPNTGFTIGDPLGEHTTNITNILFSPNGKLIASTDASGTTKLWDATSKQQIGHPLNASSSSYSYHSAMFSSDSKSLLIGYEFPKIIIWDIKTEQRIALPIALQGNSFALSPNDKILASNYDNGIGLWNVGPIIMRGDRPNIRPLIINTENMLGLAFSPDNKLLSLSQSKWNGNNFESFIQSINIDTGQVADKINNTFTGNYNNIAYDQQGNILAIRDEGSPSHLFINNIRTGQLVKDFDIEGVDYGSSISLSQDMQKIIFGNYDGTITIWNTTTKQFIGQPIQVHTREVISLSLNPEGRILASSGYDEKSIILTDVSTGKSIGQLQYPYDGNILGLAYSYDGKTLASVGEDSTVLLWDMDTSSWVYKVCQQAGRNFTYSEWLEYFPNEEYRKTCEQWELEPKVIITPTATP